MDQLPQKNSDRQKMISLSIIGLISQVGFLTVGIIVIALVGGIFLDNRLGTKPWFTFGLVLGSVPVSLIAMVLVAKAMVKKIKPESSLHFPKEGQSLGDE